MKTKTSSALCCLILGLLVLSVGIADSCGAVVGFTTSFEINDTSTWTGDAFYGNAGVDGAAAANRGKDYTVPIATVAGSGAPFISIGNLFSRNASQTEGFKWDDPALPFRNAGGLSPSSFGSETAVGGSPAPYAEFPLTISTGYELTSLSFTTRWFGVRDFSSSNAWWGFSGDGYTARSFAETGDTSTLSFSVSGLDLSGIQSVRLFVGVSDDQYASTAADWDLSGTVANVPEPSSALLSLGGLVVIGLRRRRKYKE